MNVESVPPGWSYFAHSIMQKRYAHDLAGPRKETWEEVAKRVPAAVFGPLMHMPGVPELANKAERFIAQRKLLPGGRYLYASGRPLHQVQNCLLTRVKDTREGWANHLYKHVMGLGTGAGMGTVYSALREEGAMLARTGGVASGPLPLMISTNEVGRGMRQGGSRRSALWAGLHWWHPDNLRFLKMKNWSPEIKALKAKDFNFPAPMDQTNISNCLDDMFIQAMKDPNFQGKTPVYHDARDGYLVTHAMAQESFWTTVRQMLETGEPGFSIDVGANAGEDLRNACTEVSSYDDSDICNLGSINMARIESKEEMAEIVLVATAFLLAGTVYSDVPYALVGEIREKNRRLGLGLMGLHEWLLKHGKSYGPDAELAEYLDIYAGSTEIAWRYADAWGLSRPAKTRAIAPNGTIGIVAETTTGIEAMLYVAYKRRFVKGDEHWYQYVIDPCAKRLIEAGVKPESIETACELGSSLEGIERRVAFQAWVQRYVDHAISSTINLSSWGSDSNNESTVKPFGDMLLKYLPQLRGITVYPDGSRGGQPITEVSYRTALKHMDQEFPERVVIEQGDVCDLTRGGTCGM